MSLLICVAMETIFSFQIKKIKKPIDRIIHGDYYGQNRIKLPFLDQNIWPIQGENV